MRLLSFSVRDYRSVTKAHKLALGSKTVLVGPNNEGKSNILHALVTALFALRNFREGRVVRGTVRIPTSTRRLGNEFASYVWERDYPVDKQASNPDNGSVLTLEFGLSTDEVDAFRETVGSTINGTLPVELTFTSSELKMKIRKRGPGATALSKKADRIGRFVASHMDFEYIGAVRTAVEARQIVERMVSRELRALESNAKYREALDNVAKMQAPILEALSESLTSSLRQFLPDVSDVAVQVSENSRYRAMRRLAEIVVNDGTPTELSRKGDGVQSLAALSLMRNYSEYAAAGRDLLFAIEEPESHLHPDAIHQLRAVIDDMAENHQVLMTTHSPLLVDRSNVSANVLVTNNRAAAAKSILEVRQALGVRMSDNMQSASLVLLVEGEDDRRAIGSILAQRSERLARALREGELAVDSLLGGTNLAYKASLARAAICEVYALVDDDEAGNRGVTKAVNEGLLSLADITFTKFPGKQEAEMEDFYLPTLYDAHIQGTFGVVLDVPSFRSRKKWSVRMRETFQSQGKQWNDGIEAQAKAGVANLVVESPKDALLGPAVQVVDSLVVSDVLTCLARTVNHRASSRSAT